MKQPKKTISLAALEAPGFRQGKSGWFAAPPSEAEKGKPPVKTRLVLRLV